jgi:hypothetical protein
MGVREADTVTASGMRCVHPEVPRPDFLESL